MKFCLDILNRYRIPPKCFRKKPPNLEIPIAFNVMVNVPFAKCFYRINFGGSSTISESPIKYVWRLHRIFIKVTVPVIFHLLV